MRKAAYRLVPVLLAFLGFGVSQCAKRGAPPGGPPDTTAPFVSEIMPQSGSVGVDPAGPISVQFSERMKKRTVETGIIINPPCRWKKRYWDKNTYVMVPEAGLRTNTTYLVSASNKITDAHGVAMTSTFVAGFSTGDSIDAGVISGEILWKRMTVEAAVVVLFDRAAIDSAEGWPVAEPLYLTLSGPKGAYEIPFVNTAVHYKVLAFLDKNMDSVRDEGEEVGCYAGEVVFGDEKEMGSIDVTLCGESLAGTLKGRIDTSAVIDTLQVGILARSLSDSAVIYKASPEADGAFEIGCVEAGGYALEAFYDLNGDGIKDPEDSFFVEIPETLVVESCGEPTYVEMGFGDED
jgi:hypothetical protein